MHIDRPIAIALTLFAILLLMFFLVLPEYDTFKALRVELGGKRAEYAAKFDYYSAIGAAYINLQNHPDGVQKIDDALPKNSSLGNVIYFFQKTATNDGLVIKDLFLSKSASSNPGYSVNSNVKDVIFSIDLQGDYVSLEKFIISLQESARIFEVSSITFDSASKPPYNFNLQIKTHSY